MPPRNRQQFGGYCGSQTTPLILRKNEVGYLDSTLSWWGLEPAGADRCVACQCKIADPWLLESDGPIKLDGCAKELVCHFR